MTDDRSRPNAAVHDIIEAVSVDGALEQTYSGMISDTAGRIFTAKGSSISPENFIKSLFRSFGNSFTYNASVYTVGVYLKILARKRALEFSALAAPDSPPSAYHKYSERDLAKKVSGLDYKSRVFFTLYFVYYNDIDDIALKLRKTTDYVEKKINSLTSRLIGRHRDYTDGQARRIVRSLSDGLDEEFISRLTLTLNREDTRGYPSFKDSIARKSGAAMLFILSAGMLAVIFNLDPVINYLRTVEFLPSEWFVRSPEPVRELLVSIEQKAVQLPQGEYIVDSVLMMPDSNGLLTAEIYIIAPFKYNNEAQERTVIQDLYGHIPECTVLSPYKKTKQASRSVTVMDDMTCIIKYMFYKIDYTETILLNVDDLTMDYTLSKFSGLSGYSSVQWPQDRGVSLKVLPVPDSDYVLAYTAEEAITGVEDASYGMAGTVTDTAGEEFEFDFYTVETNNGGSILMRSKTARKIQSLSVSTVYKYYLYEEDDWYGFVIPNPPSGEGENVNGFFSYRGMDYSIAKVYRHPTGVLDMYLDIIPSPQSSPLDMCETLTLYCEYATHSEYDRDRGIYSFKNIGYAPNKVWISIVSQILTTTGEWTVKYPS